ncbi:MAG: hypothetical protein RLY70_1611 [Planctomycetota bacterium]
MFRGDCGVMRSTRQGTENARHWNKWRDRHASGELKSKCPTRLEGKNLALQGVTVEDLRKLQRASGQSAELAAGRFVREDAELQAGERRNAFRTWLRR